MKKTLYVLIAAALFSSGWLIGTITYKTPMPFCPSDFQFNMDYNPDASFTVADGQVEVFYPSNGLYGLGAELNRQKTDQTETVVIAANPDDLREKPQLKRVATGILAKSTVVPDDFDLHKYAYERPESYFEEGGFRYINGRETYVGVAKETHSVWTALFIHDNHLIEISMGQAQLIGDPLSMAAWANNDRLFERLVEGIQINE